MNRFLKAAIGLCAAFIVLISAGCVAVVFAAGAAAGISGAVWYHGEMRTSLAGSLAQVRDATEATLEKMGKGVTSEGAGALECTLTSYSDDGQKITILLKSLSSSVTEVHVRVGFWGDQTLSRTILERISERLGNRVSMAPIRGTPAAILLPATPA